jgi:hypothetical protein
VAQIGDAIAPTEGARKHLADIRMKQRENMQKEEDERIARMAAEERKAKEKKSDEQHTDPGKKVAGDRSGKQGMHHDDHQGTSVTTQPGQPTEPTPEMKSE